MPTLAELVARCERIGRELRSEHLSRFQLLDAATTLLLMVGILERILHQDPVVDPAEPALASIQTDLATASMILQGIRAVAQTAGETALRRDLLEAHDVLVRVCRLLRATMS